MEPRPHPGGGTSAPRKPGEQSRGNAGPLEKNHPRMCRGKPLGARGAHAPGDGLRECRVHARRNGRLLRREWANRRMKSDEFEIPGSCGPIRGDAYVPDGSLGTVVVCHGFKGFAHGGFFPYLAQRLWERSLTAITFDFSGTGIGADRLNFTELERCYSNTYL